MQQKAFKPYIFIYSTCLIATLFLFSACNSAPEINNWTMAIPVIGSNASPRATDLTGDGVKDIVIGAGRNEFQDCKHGVIAINGATGDTIWTYPGVDQIYGSPVFLDLSSDQISDVIMVGRDKQLYAINGKSGELIWKYTLQSDEYSPLGLTRFNFYNPLLIDDYSGDNIPDLLVVNGGNVNAAAGDSINRYPGVLLVMNSVNGDIIALDTMPDGRESYLTPTYFDFDQDGTP